ncbi:hypothetical protein [Candidatus Nitronereus thalassa]|uniref:Secreted protein n=1 Tax=Candidatus Nitronereus thalassa TaxID=3020898 RepID=A0ABU3K5Z0_9BACT|nr:hypothetical protein [Candidatus Nitronereus thalassa]MDT7041788.1 hypothetical protein [Candidatus Nitronereus thalassa]
MPSQQNPICVLVMLSIVWLFGVGCSSTPEEPSTSRTTQEMRGDSDRFFQKMEQEEKKK